MDWMRGRERRGGDVTVAKALRIQRSGDCGNSPKNRLLEALTVALLAGDAARVTALTSASVRWRMPNRPPVEGQAAVVATAVRERAKAGRTLTIHHVVSHGRAGAVTVSLQRGRHAALEWCLFFTFATAAGRAVDSITTYRAE